MSESTTSRKPFNRFQAGGLHMVVSGVIALAAMILVYGFWYPGALADAQDVGHLLPILIGVDVVVGPLITTVIYRHGKKGLRFDLAVIAVMQTAALVYGLLAIWGGRPAYVVFNTDRFDVVSSKDLNADSLSRARPDLRFSWFGPRFAGALPPSDQKKREAILFSAVAGGADLPQFPEYFVPIEQVRDAMIAHRHPLDELRSLNHLDDASWKKLIDGYSRPESELAYLPMKADARDGVVLIDAKTGAIVDLRMLTPRFDAAAKAGLPH